MEPVNFNRIKKTISENSHNLNRETQLNILKLIMLEADNSIIMETNKKEIDINLDLLENKNPELLLHIYNIVKRRIDILNQPIKTNINEYY